jgi:hypothetical protein
MRASHWPHKLCLTVGNHKLSQNKHHIINESQIAYLCQPWAGVYVNSLWMFDCPIRSILLHPCRVREKTWKEKYRTNFNNEYKRESFLLPNHCKQSVAIDLPDVIAFFIASMSLGSEVSSISTLSKSPSSWSRTSLARFILLTCKQWNWDYQEH